MSGRAQGTVLGSGCDRTGGWCVHVRRHLALRPDTAFRRLGAVSGCAWAVRRGSMTGRLIERGWERPHAWSMHTISASRSTALRGPILGSAVDRDHTRGHRSGDRRRRPRHPDRDPPRSVGQWFIERFDLAILVLALIAGGAFLVAGTSRLATTVADGPWRARAQGTGRAGRRSVARRRRPGDGRDPARRADDPGAGQHT